MCVCFFLEIHVIKIIIKRWFWEINMLSGSLVELLVGLHSCLCFSHLEKLILNAGSTPRGSIELLFLVLLSCSSIRQLSTTISLDTSSTDISIPLDNCICQDLLLVLFKHPMWSVSHFTRSLSQYVSDFSLKLSHLTPLTVPQGFFKPFQVFLHLVSF